MVSRDRRRRWPTLLVALAIATAGCGSRLTTEEIRAQNVVRGSGSSPGGPASTGAGGGDQAGAAGPGGAVAAGPGGAVAAGPGGAVVADAGGAVAADAGGAVVGASSTGSATGGSVVTPGGQSAAVTGGTKAPIVIGLIGYLSGLAGSTLNPARDAWVAWQRMVNAKGGINGHPVNLLVADDGGNASTSLSIARDFVENKGAIALTALESSGVPFADYAKSKSIPVIGTIAADDTWNQNPMLLPPFPASEAASWGAARLMKLSGAVKVAFLYCAESQDCQAGKAKFVGYAQKDGLQVVYTAEYSVTQPDFTAECLQMKGDGVQAVLPVGDNASLIRMAQSCGRQGFRPSG
jgi:branched-chain amino acid transport system substrate-binding protein